jgi:hypothetical protein
MLGARRRPYVDMVKPGNDADGAPERGAGAPVSGDATVQARMARGESRHAMARSGVAPTRKRAGTAPPSACLLAATRRDGALWAHFVVGRPYNIDILLQAILLKLHPISPPSHTCLLLR